jgi:hypothetical protein
MFSPFRRERRIINEISLKYLEVIIEQVLTNREIFAKLLYANVCTN